MENPDYPPLPQDIEQAAEKIDRILHQMLLLADLSANGSNVDRQTLQKVLDRLKKKIDAIADKIGE